MIKKTGINCSHPKSQRGTILSPPFKRSRQSDPRNSNQLDPKTAQIPGPSTFIGNKRSPSAKMPRSRSTQRNENNATIGQIYSKTEYDTKPTHFTGKHRRVGHPTLPWQTRQTRRDHKGMWKTTTHMEDTWLPPWWPKSERNHVQNNIRDCRRARAMGR